MTSCQPKRRRVEHLRCSAQPSSIREDDEDADDRRVGVERRISIVVERYGNGTSKRYFLDDDDSPLQGILEERETKPDNNSQSSNSSETNILWLPDVVRDFVFPSGFPGTCTCQLQIPYVSFCHLPLSGLSEC
jgi:hypothetical protein